MTPTYARQIAQRSRLESGYEEFSPKQLGAVHEVFGPINPDDMDRGLELADVVLNPSAYRSVTYLEHTRPQVLPVAKSVVAAALSSYFLPVSYLNMEHANQSEAAADKVSDSLVSLEKRLQTDPHVHLVVVSAELALEDENQRAIGLTEQLERMNPDLVRVGYVATPEVVEVVRGDNGAKILPLYTRPPLVAA